MRIGRKPNPSDNIPEKERLRKLFQERGNPFDKSTWENAPQPQFGAEQASAIGTLLKGGK